MEVHSIDKMNEGIYELRKWLYLILLSSYSAYKNCIYIQHQTNMKQFGAVLNLKHEKSYRLAK